MNENIYLNLEIRKSQGKTDEFGNYIFEVEASNENLDLQNQVVLQRALMESKDDFLTNGVISFDHLHKRTDENGNVISDPSMVIGEPIDVYFDESNKKTIVKGKLYANNDKARDLIKMLKAGSTRVRASVGGIFPKIVKNVKTGVEKVTSVFWNDLALTTSPVNNTVGSAVFAKSMTAAEFVEILPIELKKALCAGYNTDSATKSGGQSLIKEDMNTKIADVSTTQAIKKSDDENEEKAVARLLKLARKGKIDGKTDAIDFLLSNGIEKEKAEMIFSEIINQGGKMMKKSFSKEVDKILKSLSVEQPNGEDEEIKKGENENADGINLDDDENKEEDEIDLDEDEIDLDEDEIDEEDEDDEEDEKIDGKELMKSLDSSLKILAKSQKDTDKRLNDLGKSIVGLAKIVNAIANQEIPPRSMLNKSMNGYGTKGTRAKPTEDDLFNVQLVLKKAVDEGEIDIIKSSMISSDFQKCMLTGRPMNPKYYEFLQERLNKGVK